ncbi:Ig-like domain-containing protein [Maribacter sp. PR1]|uniref:Ig-like domain-containing protein n=1 Tax=Maribacter cobaltidurans TaxID=1178778 RepID=A0ABU7IVR4_9FLAO|nr:MULTISPECIES: Ig-like domain-containing protein [Maribacter]MDC6389678.1 Ig-like domain-containing protein [Maribacter sp. PR1]MEE1977067.1 Ig-like domain-containing protein [Maribacter cobaltidurans]
MGNNQLFVVLILFAAMTVVAQKVPPVAIDDVYNIGFQTPRVVNGLNGVLFNDTDANAGTTLQVRTTPLSGPGSGSLSLLANGGLTYTPNNGFVGTDSFTYQVCDDGSPNNIVSRFDFDDPDLTLATVGPNATSINPSAAQTGCGTYFPSGSGGSTGFDINIPNTGGIFDFTSFTVSFEYEDQESTADIITGGNLRVYHISGNNIGLRVDVINGTTGLPDSFTINLGSFVSGSVPYVINYDEITGNVTFSANGATTVFPLAPEYSPLNTGLATDVLLGKFMDGSGSARPSLCSMEFIDNSHLCDSAIVTLNVAATVITNRGITYRIKAN